MNNDLLARIEEALDAAGKVLNTYAASNFNVRFKKGSDPVTEADTAANEVLRKLLVRANEGWLSEETADTEDRLRLDDVWIVDPLDGTREFVEGIPEWVVSVGFVHKGKPLAGGICNPQSGEVFLGSLETGMTYNGRSVSVRETSSLNDAVVLASRSEFKRGDWEKYHKEPFTVRVVGSVAYKLAMVAAGLADATWTLVPKHEWDVAAGTALVLSAGGMVYGLDGSVPRFNQPNPKLSGLVAHSVRLAPQIHQTLKMGPTSTSNPGTYSE